MKKYAVTLRGHYEKTISVYADTPEEAKKKTETVLFDTDLIDFTDDDFVYGEADITECLENSCGLFGMSVLLPRVRRMYV